MPATRGADERLALAAVALLLLALVLAPALLERHAARLRAEITAVHEPARALVRALELAQAREVADFRGYLLTGDSVFVVRYWAARADEARAAAALAPLARRAGPSVERPLAEMRARAAAWHGPHGAFLAGGVTRAAWQQGVLARQTEANQIVGAGARTAAALADVQAAQRAAIARVERWGHGLGAAAAAAAFAAATLLSRLAARARKLAASVARARDAAEAARADAEAARRDAELANRVKGEFLATMSHELRTPLNAIGGYADLLGMGLYGPITAEQQGALERVQKSQRALLALINEVLNYARLESGAVAYDLTDVVVADAVGAAEVLVAPQLQAKGLAYTSVGCDRGPDGRPVSVRADRDKLQQVLLNLLSNAVKFTDAVHPRDGRPGHVEVSCAAGAPDAPEPAVHIHVRDTGIGIPADKLAAVFEPFVQVDQRLTRPHEGTGLGLAISRDLARGMGGDLTAESTPGVGSAFTLTLPRA